MSVFRIHFPCQVDSLGEVHPARAFGEASFRRVRNSARGAFLVQRECRALSRSAEPAACAFTRRDIRRRFGGSLRAESTLSILWRRISGLPRTVKGADRPSCSRSNCGNRLRTQAGRSTVFGRALPSRAIHGTKIEELALENHAAAQEFGDSRSRVPCEPLQSFDL